jgi:hypothetical protein
VDAKGQAFDRIPASFCTSGERYEDIAGKIAGDGAFAAALGG